MRLAVDIAAVLSPAEAVREARLRLGAALLVACLAAGFPGFTTLAGAQTASQAAQRPHALEEGRKLLKEGKYVEAEALARTRLPEVEAAHGAESVQAAEVLDVLVESLWQGGRAKDPAARAMAERAAAIKENALGPEHPDVAASLNNLASLLWEAGQYAGARPLLERSLAISERALGPEHPDVAGILSNFAMLLKQIGDYAGAKPLLERSLNVLEKALGPEHPDVARIQNNLGLLLRQTGDYAQARPLFERALAISEQLGPEHPLLATSLNNLATLYWQTGDYARARPLFERSLTIKEKTLGPEHPEVAVGLNNLASLLRVTGDYAGARLLHERALAIRERALGPEHPAVGTSLNNLARLLDDTGDQPGARRLYERALAIKEKALGPQHPDVAVSLNNLAMLPKDAGDHVGAKPLLERSLAIYEKALGSEHPLLATSLNNLANLLRDSGDYAAAMPLHERALAIREKNLGAEHPEVANSLNNIANLLGHAGQHAAARPLYERSLAILKKAFGAEHPSVAEAAGDFAELLADIGSTDAALDWALRAEDIGRAHLRLTARTLAEREALGYGAKRISGLGVALSLAASKVKSLDKEWDALIRSRALVLDEMAARHRVVAEAGNPQVASLARAVFSARQRLANLIVRGPADKLEIYRRLIDEAQREREQAERALAERAASFRREQTRELIGFPEVAAALAPGTALVAFVRYDHRHRPDPVMPGDDKPPGRREPTPSYLAFVLSSARAKPAVLPLGAADEIDRLVGRWRREAEAAEQASAHPLTAESRYRLAGQELRQKIWDPLLPQLGKPKTVFVVPDGALNLVSLASLPFGASQYLVETGPSLHYLSAERDLVADPVNARRGGLLAVGGPAFDERSPFAALAPRQPLVPAGPRVAALEAPPAVSSVFRGQRSSCGDFDTMQFVPLPSTVRETEAVTSLWSTADNRARVGSAVVRLTGAEATETSFKEKAPGHRVLHLATHGFFLGERCPSAAESQRGPIEADRPRIGGENPLLLSGLALAGANHRSAAGASEDDGILTAEEIAALDLSSVEWAVLSACDTGVGEVRAGEGVFGLRRAFQVAGARTLIMSLWSQDDESARRWMEALYEARLKRKRTTAGSVREASLTLLQQRRKRGESTHPFFWAGFVAAGDWR